MKETPPSCASATASLGPETACMMAETMGMFSLSEGSSPLRKRTSGVSSETFAGMFSCEE